MVVTLAQDIHGVAAAAQCVVETHFRLVEFLRAGLTLPEVDGFVARTLDDLDCTSCFLKYRIRGHPPFPSHACLSVNDCIVHGTHTMKRGPLLPGDLISIDIGVKHRGWIGDAAWTYAIEHASPESLRLMHCGRESLARGIRALQPGAPLLDWARAVQPFVERDCSFHLSSNLGGHGFGRSLHGPPFVSNVVPRNAIDWPDAALVLRPGMLLAVEPMVAIGTSDTRTVGREWPIFTADGSLAVHYEADVLITAPGDDGPRNLTEGMNELPDIVGAVR